MFTSGDGRCNSTRKALVVARRTSNGIRPLKLFGLKINKRSVVEQLARGLKARVGSLATLWLEYIVLDVEDKKGFLDPPACSSFCTW
jgi:hypothetical protein